MTPVSMLAALSGAAGFLCLCAGYGPVYAGPAGRASDVPQEGVVQALRFAKQAEAAGASGERDRFIAQTDQALQEALNAAAQVRSHRMAEGVHALREALAQGHQGSLSEAREDLQSAIVWLSRAAGYPETSPSATWTPGNERRMPPTAGGPDTRETHMNHFVTNIEEATVQNKNFRRVLFTAEKSQLVLMALKPGEDIGAETHDLDQFIRVESGHGAARLNGNEYSIQDGSALVIPAGTAHNIINTSRDEELKLYTLYSPPEHKDGTVHRTKQEAEADKDDHFDGRTSAMLHETPAQR